MRLKPFASSSNLSFTPPFSRTGSNPKIRRNKIWGGQNGGILVYNSGESASDCSASRLSWLHVHAHARSFTEQVWA